MSCKKYMAEIEEAAAGAEPSPGARLHLDACAACRTFERERASLRQLVGSLAGAAAPADFEFRLRARMRSEASAPRRGLFAGALAPASGAALAACLVAAVSASLYVGRRGAGEATPARVENQQARSQQATHAPAADEAERTRAADTDSRQGQALAAAAVEADGRGVTGAQQRAASRHLAAAASERSRTPEGVERRTASFNQTRATVISNPSAGEVALTGPPVALPLPKSERPLKVLMRDERGAARVVPVRSVSFGSQELVARAGAQRAGVGGKEVAW